MSIKQARKDLDKEVLGLLETISELEIQVNQLLELGNKSDSVYSSLSKIKDLGCAFENDDMFIIVPLDKKIKARQVNVENFKDFFADKLELMNAKNISEVFETSNTVGVFADIAGESIEITANKLNTVESLCISVSGVNENGLKATNIKKAKRSKIR